MAEPWFPPATDWRYALGALVLSTLVFHVLFLSVFRLGRRGWKKVDYWWLGLASIALFGAAGTARQTIAAWQVEPFTARVNRVYNDLRSFTHD